MKNILIKLFVFLFILQMGCMDPESEKEPVVIPEAPSDNFVVVIPQESTELVKNLADGIVEYVKQKTGVEFMVRKDGDVSTGLPEILLGETNRDDSFDVYSLLKKETYKVVCTQSGNIVVAGVDIYNLVHAVDQLIAFGFETVEKDSLRVSDFLDLHGELKLSEFEKQGTLINHRMRSVKVKTVQGQSDISNLREIRNVRMITQLAGEYSLNRTRTRYNVSVADLGSMCLHHGKLYFFFGDTFGGENLNLDLRSNVVAYTTDFDYTDGILFDGYLTDNGGRAVPVTQGNFGKNEQANVAAGYEYTKIPTGALSLNGSLYMSYMSVAWWMEENDNWVCNYGGIMKSENDGTTWFKLDAQWPGNSKFCQMYPVMNMSDNYIYVVGISGGRQGTMRMMRVPQEKYEMFDAYEYLVGYGVNGNAVWRDGYVGLHAEFPLINEKVWEPCMIYSDYLEEWIISYKNADGIQLYTSKRVEGPYQLAAAIPYKHDIAGYYGVYMHPVLSSDGGSKLALLMSSMYPLPGANRNMWQVSLMEITLVRK